MFVYSVIMASYGWYPSTLLGAVSPDRGWEDKTVNNMPDSWGQEWTYAQRRVLEEGDWTPSKLFSTKVTIID